MFKSFDLGAIKCGKTQVWHILLCLIVLFGMVLRMLWLGTPALRADTILFFSICQQAPSSGYIMTHWIELTGFTGQFPLPVALIRFFLDIFHLPLTHFTLRLPDVFWAGLSIFAAGQAGRRLLSPRTGLIWAALLALHPYFIQATREPYYYAPMICGLALLLWGAALVFCRYQGKEESLPAWQYVSVLVAGTALAVYSQPSGWGLVALIMASVYLVLLIARQWRVLIILSGILFLLALPMLFAPWGLTQIRALASAEHQQASLRLLAGEYRKPLFDHLREVWLTFSWGHGVLRAIPAVLAVLLWGDDIRRNRKNLLRYLIAALFLGSTVFSLAAQMHAATFQTSRYMFSIFPLLLGGYAQGLAGLLDRLQKPLLRRIAQGAVALFFFIPLIPPAVQSVRLTGSPTPYKDIVRWCDTQLAPGTPVLVDRWFEPWNELKVCPSTNVFFTFTVPNEPLDTYLQVNWRKTAEQFFEKYPDAVYLEIAKSYWENPQVGPWQWPRKYFKQRAVIRNEAGLKLREAGLLYREDGGPYTNRLSVEIFYNTTDDLIAAARQQGRDVLRLYGEGWGYAKPGWQQGHFEDYRTFGQTASMDIYNLKETLLTGSIEISAAAAQRPKTVSVSNANTVFTPGRIRTWTVPLTLQSGRNTVPFISPSSDPLFVLDIRWTPSK